MTDFHENWGAFLAKVYRRLEAGRETYQDRSFTRPPAELAVEIEQEILDLAAWSFILWTRLQPIKDRIGQGGQG